LLDVVVAKRLLIEGDFGSEEDIFTAYAGGPDAFGGLPLVVVR
jgi:hypothetical protein